MSEKTRVLYFEDDVGSQRLVKKVLENRNYEVYVADSGLRGIELARCSDPHLVLMDINLPGMNGREITTRLRGLAGFDQVPIVALTANSSPGHRERALAAGCDGYLTKPITVSTFPEEVESFLNGRREQLPAEAQLLYLERHAQELVTHLEEKVQEMETANQQLRELDRMKSNFIGLVSHELRTPLTLLEGYSHLLDEQLRRADIEKYPPGLLPLLEGLETGVNRISGVINEIINISRIASGRLELSIGPVQLNSLVTDVIADHEKALQQRQLSMQVSGVGELPLIQADGKQLRTALSNVVGNAVKYTPDGGTITIRGRVHPDAVDLAVTDTGIGIPLEEQRRIFDEFYVLQALEHHSTSKTAFKGGGLGLGLAIAKGIVNAHGGRIWVESQGHDSEENPGSTFHLLLPISGLIKG